MREEDVKHGLRFLVICSVVLCVWVGWVVPRLVASPDLLPPPVEPKVSDYLPPNPLEDQQIVQLQQENRQLRRQVASLKRTLLHQPNVVEALDLACTIYGNCTTLWRKARCESHLHRYAQNRGSHASGLFQFLPSTWASTPFGRFSVFSPYANALAAGWMHEHGRGGEWVCR